MWILTAWGKTRSGIIGVPWRDLTDEEFAAAEALFAPGELRSRGYFERERFTSSRGRRAVRTTVDAIAEPETPAEEEQS